MLNDLKEIIAINSVEAPRSAIDAPFGQEVRNALDWFLNKCSSYGLKVGENHGYYGWAEYGESGAPIIGIPVHLDIVPVGEGWASDPLSLRIEDGKAYGRGTSDDKGPAVAVIWALKKIREEKIKLRHRIRIIAGCNEETGSACLKKYASEDEIPVMSFVPDSEFPVTNSEKGILHLLASTTMDEGFGSSVSSISASERINVVPSSATVTIKRDSVAYNFMLEHSEGALTSDIFRVPAVALRIIETSAKPEDFSLTETDEGVTITALGVAGHASTPETADNALWKIFAFLRAVLPESETAKAIFENFCRRDALQKINAYSFDEESGESTISFDMVQVVDNKLNLYFDLRLPICAVAEEVENAIGSAIAQTAPSCEVTVERLRFNENLFVPASSPLIKTLLSVYAKATGEVDPKPLQTGGGTYARELPNAVAFGPTFKGRETNIHNVDENIPVEDLFKLVDIYYDTILELDKL